MTPITRDWINRARNVRRKAERAEECRGYLEQAEAIADTADHWISIAEVWAELADEHAARRCIATAVANPSDRSTFTAAAVLFLRELHDAESARDALARCTSYLQDRESGGADWAALARAYVRTLDDQVTARQLLELAQGRVRESSWDLLYLATCYVEELGDREAARPLVVRAEAVSSPHDSDRIAAAYRDLLGDEDRAWQLLEATLAGTQDLRVCRAIARHAMRLARADAPALERAALATAEAHAKTANDWLDLAEYYYDREPRELDAVRRCLERALAADLDGKARIAIAHAYRHRLDDADTAGRLAAAGVTPKELVITRHTLDGWTADPARLLDWLRPQLEWKRLDRLAAAAGFAKEKHFAAIEDIHRTGLVPYPLGWYPRETLQLEQWTEGASVDHLRRAFACTIQLIDTAGPDFRDGFEATIAVLVESCKELGSEALAGAIGLLVALAESFDPDLPAFAFALFGLLLAAAVHDPHDTRLPALCDRLITIVSGYERVFSQYTTEWLLGLTIFDSRHPLFRSLAANILGAPSQTDPALAHLGTIASRLAPIGSRR